MTKPNLTLLAVALSAVLAGCSAADATGPSPAPSPAGQEAGTEEKTAGKETVRPLIAAETLTLRHVSAPYDTPYTDPDDIELFMQAIHTAERIQGILNVGEPEYVLQVGGADGKAYTYQLWINDAQEEAMLMDMQDTHTGYTVSEPLTGKLKQMMFAEPEMAELSLRTGRNAAGELVAVPEGLRKDLYSLTAGPVVELKDRIYLSGHLFYGNHNAVNFLAAGDSASGQAEVLWSGKLTDSNNRWNNAFMNSYTLLVPLDEDRLLFIEPEIIGQGGHFHLSAYDVRTGDTERLREDFWLVNEDYDYIYTFDWKADEQTLFMQSFLGNVWFFDLKTGEDEVHLEKYRVIPHSTTGAPSLFLSPSYERFVHDDESGVITFYSKEGKPLNTVSLPEEDYVPSEKIKWNPSGTVAWMDQSGNDHNRILGADIDYLKIAPQQVHFYDPDGRPLATVQAEGGDENAAVEVAGWIDGQTAVMKSYTLQGGMEDQPESRVQDASYYLYNVRTKQAGKPTAEMPHSTTPVTDSRYTGQLPEQPAFVVEGEIRFRTD